MTQRSYIFFIFIITLINGLFWAMTLNFINPEAAGFWGFVFFYFSLFFTLFGVIYLLSYFFHAKVFQWSSSFKNVQVSTRQAALFSALLVGCLVMQANNLLTWYNVILFIVILTLLEFLFMSKKRSISYARKTE